jgi:hypothetical protein
MCASLKQAMLADGLRLDHPRPSNEITQPSAFLAQREDTVDEAKHRGEVSEEGLRQGASPAIRGVHYLYLDQALTDALTADAILEEEVEDENQS